MGSPHLKYTISMLSPPFPVIKLYCNCIKTWACLCINQHAKTKTVSVWVEATTNRYKKYLSMQKPTKTKTVFG